MVESNTCLNLFIACEDKLSGFFKNLEEEREKFVSVLDKEAETFLKAVQKFAKTGDIDERALKTDDKESNSESEQENASSKKGRSRKKKPILGESNDDNLQGVKIKKEKISVATSETTRSSITSTISSTAEIPGVVIKTEEDDMPAPNWIPPKKKTVRSTRTKGKKASIRDSDVVVQNPPITIINLSDTEEPDGDKALQKERSKRSTRTKTKLAQTQVQIDSGTETDTESVRSTRTKTKTKKEKLSIESSEVEETRSTRTKTRKGKKAEEESKENEPEEIIQETRTTRTKTIRKGMKEADDLADVIVNHNNNKEETVAEPTRSTRTKTRKAAEKNTEEPAMTNDGQKSNEVSTTNKAKAVPEPNKQIKEKRNRSESSDDEQTDGNSKKRSKSISPVPENEANGTTRTVYEDARSTLGASQEKAQQQLNSTYVACASTNAESKETKQVPLLNATVTIEPSASSAANRTMVISKPQINNMDKKSNNMFTDDESIEVTPPKKTPSSKVGKEVFSPYEKCTTKKKVEAFEKLQNSSEIPVKYSTNLRSTRDTPTSVKEKAKMFTPLGSKFMPASSSTSKISRLISNHHNSTSNDSLLGLKSAQKDSRDRQRKLIEREQALKKKEAMLQAQMEAKRKLNEEKQLKAQQQRKALEADKQKQLEQQKQKEAKLRQRELEREEYLRKQKLELEKKRVAQKKKLQEFQVHRQQVLDEQARNPPIYMTSRPPKLPTVDCYDSDDPDYKKVKPPSWCEGDYSRTKQLTMLAAGDKIKNTLFCRHAQTPDLIEIFEVIDPKKLKRSSSVLWRQPPRYTMMPNLNETRFSEDDELYDSD